MKKKIGVAAIITIILVSMVIIYINNITPKAELVANVINNLSFAVQDSTASNKGDLLIIKIVNNSDLKIYNDNVFFNYPIKQKNGYVENKYKIEAVLTKKVMKPKEEMFISVLIPFGDFISEENFHKDLLYYEYEGYYDKISEKTSFFISNYIPTN
ncbi:MAG: hypothetical protein K0S01_129 [Herbinix sp.]|nr:hypothetical protein [Herbinix sp.]